MRYNAIRNSFFSLNIWSSVDKTSDKTRKRVLFGVIYLFVGHMVLKHLIPSPVKCNTTVCVLVLYLTGLVDSIHEGVQNVLQGSRTFSFFL